MWALACWSASRLVFCFSQWENDKGSRSSSCGRGELLNLCDTLEEQQTVWVCISLPGGRYVKLSFCQAIHSYLYAPVSPVEIITQPLELSSVAPSKPVTFTVSTTGKKPLSYQWQWKPPKKEGVSEEWLPCCDVEMSDGATLTIPSVQKSNEGNYRCVIGKHSSSLISKPVQLSVGKSLKCVPEVWYPALDS